MSRLFTGLPVSAVLLALLTLLPACGGEPPLPDPSSDTYREAVTAFYTGIGAIQAGETKGAEAELMRVTELVPQEPAAWANLGLLALRRNELDVAAERLYKAEQLAPENAEIQVLLGLLESNRGRFDESVAHLRRAVALDSTHAKAAFALAREVEREGGPESDAELQRLYGHLATRYPANLAVLLEYARVAAKRGDAEALSRSLARLQAAAADWPAEARDQLDALAAADARQAATQVAFLRNVLLRLPAFRRDLAVVQIPPEEGGELMTRFVRLPSPSSRPAPADTSLTFVPDPLQPGGGPWAWAGTFWLGPDATPALLVADAREARFIDGPAVAFPGAGVTPTAHGLAPFDYDYDFQMDLAVAGAGGLRLYRQEAAGAFRDVTASLGLPAAVTADRYVGVWAADLDLEGDVDLVLAPSEGPPRLLRNNGDGTFAPIQLFADVRRLRQFVWGDLDGDGDPDPLLLDADGRLHAFTNQRSGVFDRRALPEASGRAATLADLDADGVVEVVVLHADGRLSRLSDRDGQSWEAGEIGRMEALPADAAALLHATDLDNNGALDLVAVVGGQSHVWLGTPEGAFRRQPRPIAARVQASADLTGNGRLDLAGVTDGGQPVLLINQGLKSYHWKTLQLRAASAVGDQRINSFGIGGQVEVRSGLLYQMQPITAPVLHFGLGEQVGVDIARIVWPNGNIQAEFDLGSDQTMTASQRLKGSCPWVFTHDGQQMRFVTDFLWRSPLGLKINAQETAGIMATEDWVKIRGDQMVARDGFYDLRITAELWETHFFDHVSLLVVDHPAGGDVFVDERFAFPPPAPALHLTETPQRISSARDESGRDVTALVAEADQRYVGFPAGQYQGIAPEHFVEVELPAEATGQNLLLLARGWVRPTDSSINVALAQGTHAPPQGLQLDVPDGRGGWRTVHSNLGFPSGKEKTILVDLGGLFPAGTVPRLRLRTNLEVYWDQLTWTRNTTPQVKTQRLAPTTADLRYRGFSVVTEADRSSPELPHYDRLTGLVQPWRDLEGYHTRFGDVRELLAEIDDRYVIMNAGDEMVFRFAAPPPPPDGWTRDFVLIGDGWVKDGDYNTAFSKTVLPLPSHDQPNYDTPPTRLEDDPVYRRHPADWQTFHTRYVAPDRFRAGLRLD